MAGRRWEPSNGNNICPTSGIPSRLFYLLYGFTTCSFQFSPIRNLDLRIVQRDSEILKCNVNDISANIWTNKLGLKCFLE